MHSDIVLDWFCETLPFAEQSIDRKMINQYSGYIAEEGSDDYPCRYPGHQMIMYKFMYVQTLRSILREAVTLGNGYRQTS